METITISVVLKFSIKEFPISISELFLVIQDICRQIGKRLTVALIERIEQLAAQELKQQGWERHRYQKRTLQGVLGKISLKLLRMKHPEKGVRYAIAERIEIPAYAQYTMDAFESGLGLLPHLSYKRSSCEVERIGGSGPAKSTLHRKLAVCAEQVEVHPENKAAGYRYLVVDGTGARFQKRTGRKPKKVASYGGEVRMVYASKGVGEPFVVIGRWTNSSWKSIARTVYRRIDATSIRVVISDGGVGIEEAFVQKHMEHQRCSVHAWRDLKSLLYQDGVKKAGQREFQEFFRRIAVFDYAQKKTMESLKAEDCPRVQSAIQDSEKQLRELEQLLKEKGYHKTATYIANLSQPLLTFLRQWLATGEAEPSTSNVAENRFSLIKNRFQRIGRRWSESGLKRWIDIAIHKMFPGYDWNKLWEKLLPVAGNLTCEIVAIH
jgi:hypothetical protein